jgi:hypothetical protein
MRLQGCACATATGSRMQMLNRLRLLLLESCKHWTLVTPSWWFTRDRELVTGTCASDHKQIASRCLMHFVLCSGGACASNLLFGLATGPLRGTQFIACPSPLLRRFEAAKISGSRLSLQRPCNSSHPDGRPQSVGRVCLLHPLHRRGRPLPVRCPGFGPVQAQIHNHGPLRRRQPIGFLVLAGRLVLDD